MRQETYAKRIKIEENSGKENENEKVNECAKVFSFFFTLCEIRKNCEWRRLCLSSLIYCICSVEIIGLHLHE